MLPKLNGVIVPHRKHTAAMPAVRMPARYQTKKAVSNVFMKKEALRTTAMQGFVKR